MYLILTYHLTFLLLLIMLAIRIKIVKSFSSPSSRRNNIITNRKKQIYMFTNVAFSSTLKTPITPIPLNTQSSPRNNNIKKPSQDHRSSYKQQYQDRAQKLRVEPLSSSSTLSSPPAPILLSAEEKELFSMFRSIVEDECLGTTVRIAGGWVRDKLLNITGKEDIDVALDNMTGKEFSTVMNQWSKSKGRKTVNVGIIQQNPEKSKHLETATAQLGKFSVDFVNLRTETYASNSRIPTMQIGTPEEDATRRDLTINSLFYNVNTECIEDFTGQGLSDLKQGIVRTPLPALTTLQDDPLRALRAVRFACRFGFKMSDDLIMACVNPSVLGSVNTKVSRERINQETELMMGNTNAVRAAIILHELQLLPIILSFPNENLDSISSARTENNEIKTSVVPEQYNDYGLNILLISHLLENDDPISGKLSFSSFNSNSAISNSMANATSIPIGKNENMKNMLKNIAKSGESSRLFRLAALTHGGAALMCKHPLKANKKIPLAENVLQFRLKMRSKDVTTITQLHESAIKIVDILKTIIANPNPNQYNDEVNVSTFQEYNKENRGKSFGPVYRLDLGLVLRDAGPMFQYALVLACSQLILEAITGISGIWIGQSQKASISYQDLYQALVAIAALPNVQHILDANNYSKSRGKLIESPTVNSDQNININNLSKTASDKIKEIIKACDFFLQAINVLNLNEVWLTPPLFPGSAIKSEILKSIPQGPVFGDIMETQMRWILCNPNGSPEELQKFLQEKYSTMI